MSTRATEPHAADILDVFDSYVAASITLDSELVASYYDVPFLLVTAGSTMLLESRPDVVAFLESTFRALRDVDFEGTSFPTLRARSLGRGLEVVSGVGIRYDADGIELAALGLTYLWRLVDEAWKLTVMTIHDPSAMLLTGEPNGATERR